MKKVTHMKGFHSQARKPATYTVILTAALLCTLAAQGCTTNHYHQYSSTPTKTVAAPKGTPGKAGVNGQKKAPQTLNREPAGIRGNARNHPYAAQGHP